MAGIVLISDVHANAAALEAVLAEIRDTDLVLCAGDIVGYGPDPARCVDLLRDRRALCVMGNHDEHLAHGLDPELFHEDALAALDWQRGRLAEGHLEFLRSLPATRVVRDFTLVHGSPPKSNLAPVHPSSHQVRAAMAQVITQFCVVGHTHEPLVVLGTRATRMSLYYDWQPVWLTRRRQVIRYAEGQRVLINPGSVGQPRDGSPLASYVALDPVRRQIEIRRVPYDLAATQARMADAGLPAPMIERLAMGR